jgi:hypothetical protein
LKREEIKEVILKKYKVGQTINLIQSDISTKKSGPLKIKAKILEFSEHVVLCERKNQRECFSYIDIFYMDRGEIY